jgi:predicted TIM-barrel fold metal-dependent hydrolase
LSAHRAASPNRFRGIRHACSWDESDEIRNSHTKPPPNLYVDTRFREGFSVLAQQKMVFDAWLYHPQIYELISLARAFPEVPIVLDHVGGPLGIGPYRGKREEVLELWKKNISELATCSNVVVKLGGLSMPICGFNWHKNERPPTSKELARATAPYILYCIEQFGTDRCMFESNFPVDKVSCSYTVLWNSFKRITQAFSAAEKADLFHDTAVKTYSLSA